ncbi:MAG: homoserine O-succinyltransferase [Chitinophagaceae bacterium]|nr:homoserine O-succinyltransferase [Chitinophagaceae bacterium]
MSKTIRVAILDLNEGQPNQGMRCIRDILKSYSEEHRLQLIFDEFEVRVEKQLPNLDHDIFISSGGPGSPLESEDTEWENLYFDWIKKVETYNKDQQNIHKKNVLFICHSFQLACRYFQAGHVAKRKSNSFGVFPVHVVEQHEPVFSGLHDPFYAVDSRDYQVIEPDYAHLEKIGASILALEKERPHIPLERAVMAIRFNNYMLGTQFHPEADATGMSMYLQRADKKEMVIENIGYDKWQSMIDQLTDPDKIKWTYAHVIPNFLDKALGD